MSLDALAPDQRAVVGLVLQQGRSYAELANMLSISESTVRDRAHAGINTLADAGELDATERGVVADYLLGQDSPSTRAAARSLLATNPQLYGWATGVAAQLETLPNVELPDLAPDADAPDTDAASAAPDADAPDADAPDADAPDADAPDSDAPDSETQAQAGDDSAASTDGGAAPGGRATGTPADASMLRAKPRPASSSAFPSGGAAQKPVNRRSGGLLIATLVLVLVALIGFIATRGGDDDAKDAAATPTASPSATPTADPRYEPQGQIALNPAAGQQARGVATIYIDREAQGLTFAIQGQGLTPNGEADKYAIWLTGGGPALRLGYNTAAPVAEDGVLQIGGPTGDAAKEFTERFESATNIVVSRERDQNAKEPAEIVLSGDIPKEPQGEGEASPTP